MLQRLRKNMHRFTKAWVALFTLAWVTVVYPPCASAQAPVAAQPSITAHGHPAEHVGMDHHMSHPAQTAAAQAEGGCMDEDCPVLSALDRQAAPKPPAASDGDLHPAFIVAAPLLRLPVLADDNTSASRQAHGAPLPAFPPNLGFRILLI